MIMRFLKNLLKGEDLIYSSNPAISLPKTIIRAISNRFPETPNIVFPVQINPQTDSGVTVFRIRRRKAAFILRIVKTQAWSIGSSLLNQLIIAAKGRYSRAIGRKRTTGTEEAKNLQEGPKISTNVKSFGSRLRNYIAGVKTQSTNAVLCKSYGAYMEPDPEIKSFILVDSIRHLDRFSFPSGLHLALTKRCNLRCTMCPYHSTGMRACQTNDYFSRNMILPPELFERIIQEAGAHGAHISLGQYDEPLLYKDLPQWVMRAKMAGCGVSITTNGTLMTNERCRQLIAAGIDHISFSLDAATPETYSKIRMSSFDVPIQNLRTLVKIRNEQNAKTTIRACLVIQNTNEHEQVLFRNLMREIGIDMVSFYVLSKYENGRWINERLNFEVEAGHHSVRKPCSQLWSQMAIYPDGNVSFCCATTMYVAYRDDLPYMGNIHQSSILEIWMSDAYRQIRREALSGHFWNSICRDCEIWHNCQTKQTVDSNGDLIHRNPYETFIYFGQGAA